MLVVGLKNIPVIVCLGLILLFPYAAQDVSAADSLKIEARAYILMEQETGRVLAGKHEQRPYPPASLTKIMTEYLILKDVQAGRLNWDDRVEISPRTEKIGEAQVHLRAGEKPTVKELFKAMAVYSANDAAVALAEKAAGSETAFVKRMNREAARLGLKETHFINATGLPKNSYPDPPKVEGKNQMSARDIARLTRQLLDTFPDVTEITGIPTFAFQRGDSEFSLTNRNRMLPGLSHFYPGVDGVKTGYTSQAGYNFVGSAEREGMRLITVVMGTDSNGERFLETETLLNYGYDTYQKQALIERGKEIPGHRSLPVEAGIDREVAIVPTETREVPVRKKEKSDYQVIVKANRNLEAPVRAQTVVGKAWILYDGKKVPGIEPVTLVAKDSVEKASWITLVSRMIGSWFR